MTLLPHIKGQTNIRSSLAYQASQAKKKFKKQGVLKQLGFIHVFMACLVLSCIAMAGAFYGIMINSLDSGKAHHEQGAGFWRNESSVLEQRIAKITEHMANSGGGGGRGASGSDSEFRADSGSVTSTFVKAKNLQTRQQLQEALNGTTTKSAAANETRSKKFQKPVLHVGKDNSGEATIIPLNMEKPPVQSPESRTRLENNALEDSGGKGLTKAEASPTRGSLSEHRLRGIPPGKKAAYDGPTFLCDGATVLDVNKINDDYCDCEDGSDEPGTSACENGTFYCTASEGVAIASSRVNDGVCDCCDGSDEWRNPALKCANSCGGAAPAERGRTGDIHRAKQGLKKSQSLFAA